MEDRLLWQRASKCREATQKPLSFCWYFNYDYWKITNMRSDTYETLQDLKSSVLFIGDFFTFQRSYIHVECTYIPMLSRSPVALHKTQGRGIFMSGQDQNRKRAMSWTDWGWWVSGLITQTDWISGLKAKDSLWEHVCDSQASGRVRRMMFGGDALQVGKPILQTYADVPQPVLQTQKTGLK